MKSMYSVLTAILILSVCKVNEALSVFGYDGASSTVLSGRSLHYNIHLAQCDVISGDDDRFVETFGGHVQTWRSFNDRDISDVPFMVFFDKKMLYNQGKLLHVVREVEIWGNETGTVRTVVYTADYNIVVSMESRKCTLAAQNKTGNINFQTSDKEPEHLNSFDDIVAALNAGSGVHFQAMSFLCRGGREHTFSNFGGQIPNYELPSEDTKTSLILSSVDQTVHYDVSHDMHVLDVINLNMMGNRTVEVIDTRGRPLYQNLLHEHTSYCTLETGMPGGTFNAFAHGM